MCEKCREEGCETSPPPPIFSFSCNLPHGSFFWKLLACAVALCLVFTLFRCSTDDSDQGFWNRSGLSVYTDNATGLQYLGAPFGGLAPRLDRDGKQMRVGR